MESVKLLADTVCEKLAGSIIEAFKVNNVRYDVVLTEVLSHLKFIKAKTSGFVEKPNFLPTISSVTVCERKALTRR